MVVRARFRQWLIQYGKVGAVLYALVLALVYLAPDLQLDRDLERLLTDTFSSRAAHWTWGMPLAFVGLCIGWWLWQVTRQGWVNRKIDNRGVVRLVLPRVDAQTKPQEAGQFWNQASDLIPKHQHLTFELAGNNEQVTFALCADAGANRALVLQALADWPGTQSRLVAEPEADPLFIDESQAAVCLTLRPQTAGKAITTAVTDPLAAPLAELARLPTGVKGGILVLVRGDDVTKQKLGSDAAKASAQKTTGKSLAEKRDIKEADSRAQHIFLEVELIVWAAARTPAMARSVARSLARSVKAQYEASNPLTIAAETATRPSRRFPLLSGRPWTDSELATLAHLAGKRGAEIAPQLETAPARPLPPSSACRIPQGGWTTV